MTDRKTTRGETDRDLAHGRHVQFRLGADEVRAVEGWVEVKGVELSVGQACKELVRRALRDVARKRSSTITRGET
jgi:hypothetical protein